MKTLIATALWALLYSTLALAAESPEAGLILKVEGSGRAEVRRVSGLKVFAGAQTPVQIGDKIITDENTTVDLSLVDGTLVRVGIRSEFSLDAKTQSQKAIVWLTKLVRGTVRAILESDQPKQNQERLRISTPQGTVGIRGTDFIVDLVEAANRTDLYVLEGLVSFGANDCVKKNNCQAIPAGNTSQLTTGAAALPPTPIQWKALLQDESNKAEAIKWNRIFFGKQRPLNAPTTLEGLMQLAEKSFANAQDQALGRKTGVRDLRQLLAESGKLEAYLKMADLYLRKLGIDTKDEDLTPWEKEQKLALAMSLERAGMFNLKDLDLSKLTKEQQEQELQKALAQADKALSAKALDKLAKNSVLKNDMERLQQIKRLDNQASGCCANCMACKFSRFAQSDLSNPDWRVPEERKMSDSRRLWYKKGKNSQAISSDGASAQNPDGTFVPPSGNDLADQRRALPTRTDPSQTGGGNTFSQSNGNLNGGADPLLNRTGSSSGAGAAAGSGTNSGSGSSLGSGSSSGSGMNYGLPASPNGQQRGRRSTQ